MALLIATGAAAAVLLAMTLVLPLGLLQRALGAVAVGLAVSAVLIPAARWWVPTGVAAGFFAMVVQAAWELLVVAGDHLRAASLARGRPPTSNPW